MRKILICIVGGVVVTTSFTGAKSLNKLANDQIELKYNDFSVDNQLNLKNEKEKNGKK